MKASISIHSLVPRKNCLGEAESFSTLLNSKPSGLMYCLAGFKTMIIYPKKMVHQSSYLATQSIFFLLDFHFQFVQVKYRGQTRYSRIFERKPVINTYCSIGYRLEMKCFLFAQFFLKAHYAGPQIQKSENWGLESWDRSSRSSYWWLVSNTVDDYVLAQKILKSKIEAHPVHAGLYMACKHCISFAIVFA